MRKFQVGCPCCKSCNLLRDSFTYENGTFTDPQNRYQYHYGNLVVADGKMTNGHDAFSLLAIGPSRWEFAGSEGVPQRIEATLSQGAGVIVFYDYTHPTTLTNYIYWTGTNLTAQRADGETIYTFAVDAEEIEEDGTIKVKVWAGYTDYLGETVAGCDLSLDGSISCRWSQVMLKSGNVYQFPSCLLDDQVYEEYWGYNGLVFLEEGATADNLVIGWGAANRDDCETRVQQLAGLAPPQVFYTDTQNYLTYDIEGTDDPNLAYVVWDVVPTSVTIELGPATYGSGSLLGCPDGFDCGLAAGNYELSYIGAIYPNGFFDNDPDNAIVYASVDRLQGEDDLDYCTVDGFCNLQLSFRDPFVLQWRFVYTQRNARTTAVLGQYIWLSETTHDIRTDTDWSIIWDLANITWGSPSSSYDYCGGAPSIVSMSIA